MIPSQTFNTIQAYAACCRWDPPRRRQLAGLTLHILFADDSGLAIGPLIEAPGLSGRPGKILCAMIVEE